MVGVVTLASMTLGGCGFGTLEMLGVVAISRVLPHTMLKREADILTELLGVMDRLNLLGRDIVLGHQTLKMLWFALLFLCRHLYNQPLHSFRQSSG